MGQLSTPIFTHFSVDIFRNNNAIVMEIGRYLQMLIMSNLGDEKNLMFEVYRMGKIRLTREAGTRFFCSSDD